ncbi:MAG: hypothetical protein R3B48_30220 [Kofleriaceae bacterium]
MTRPSDIKNETEQLTKMIKLLQLDVVDESLLKSESPDFLFKLRDGRHVGVEIVSAVSQEVAQGRGTQRAIKDAVYDALNSANIKAYVCLRFNESPSRSLTRAEIRSEAQAVERLVRTTTTAGHADWHTIEGDDLEETGIEHLVGIRILASEELDVICSTSGIGMPPSIVQDAINKKVPKLEDYRRRGTDEIWLLVTASVGIGSSLDATEAQGRVFDSPFDKTIFLECFEGRCFVLPTHADKNR